MRRRTNIDFSKHVLTIDETTNAVIYGFKKPETYHGAIKFINTSGILAITGDYGNWIICREFHPSADGHVSDGYWCEKIRLSSSQKVSDHDPKATEDLINEIGVILNS